MRVFVLASALSVSLAAVPTFAQTAAPAAPPAQTAPAPAAPARPFPDGVKYGLVVVQRLATESNEGRAAAAKINALQQQKVNELNEKNKQLQALQQKLEQGGNVLNDTARTQLETDIERQQRDLQRLTEDAEREVERLSQQVQAEFERRVMPIFAKVAQEKQLHMLLSSVDAGLLWADPALDLTSEVIKQLDEAPPAAPSVSVPSAGAGQ